MKWIEITKDNVDELYKTPSNRIVVAHNTCGRIDYLISYNWHPTLNDMAKRGGYYYIALPELIV